MGKTIILAIGGNAITKTNEKGTKKQQWNNIISICKHIVELVKQGHRIVITHGNGPQVGNLLLKNEISKNKVSPMPLDVCVANTQGSLGYALSQTLGEFLSAEKFFTPVIAVITQVIIDEKDPAFTNPTKFIGPFFSELEASELMRHNSFILKEDSGRGWRRVVPSPVPIDIVEKDTIKSLCEQGIIVIAAGGGGIPVIKHKNKLIGVEAVIDKDMAGQLLAQIVEADTFLLLTEVNRVCINFGKSNQKELFSMTVAEARSLQAQGHFPAGSMGPKIEAAVQFASSKAGRESIIIALENAHLAFSGKTGTLIKN